MGASNCNNLPACPNNIGAKCAGTPSCIGATTCSYTFNNANCGDTCYGYVKTGTLTVMCGYPEPTTSVGAEQSI
ncbi:MAG: hypothetical protein ACP5HJ_03975 [Candidatus Micrarchaeia archaeon]